MTQYFSVARIKAAVESLSEHDSKWIIPPLVFASNQVDLSGLTDISSGVGSDVFLDKFFHGSLIGLPAPTGGGSINVLRPKFRELAKNAEAIKDAAGNVRTNVDYVLHQKQKLWANAYSRTGYAEMAQRGELIKGPAPSQWQLAPKFQAAFEANLQANFSFEDLLVWLYAFSGFDDAISSWTALFQDFSSRYLNGNEFPSPYQGRFRISTSPPVPWPADNLSIRPSNEELQRALLPTSFAEPLQSTRMLAILKKLEELIAAEYEGLTSIQQSELARSIVGGLMSTKRVFLLGDPGTGKSTLARLVRSAFEEVVEADRLLVISTEVTEKTTESTLVGFVGLDGEWIPGTLTAITDQKTLLNTTEQLKTAPIRNQVNLILLDEANRKDIEALLSRLQGSLDASGLDPLDPSHRIPLGKSGVRSVSPSTFVVMTGNSPRDDQGRIEQSRPFRRRPSLLMVPNPLADWIESVEPDAFSARCVSLWQRIAPTFPDAAAATTIAGSLQSEKAVMNGLLKTLRVLQLFKVGVSYGLLKKILLLTASETMLGQGSFQSALDAALHSGVSALLSADRLVDSRSLKAHLLALAPELEPLFPRMINFVRVHLSDVSDFGTVEAHF